MWMAPHLPSLIQRGSLWHLRCRERGRPHHHFAPALYRLHLSQGNRLGLVLSQHDIGRLLALHHCLEALHDDESRGHVTETLDLALQASGLDQVHVVHRPRLLSDNGPSYISADLAEWLDKRNMDHVRGTPCHPQTQGKIERWHQTLKNRILLENYYLPGDLEARIDTFVDHYNHRRYHESLDNLTPADVYFGRGQTILLQRERIKRATIQNRRLQHQLNAA
jgi:Integrase core domain